jgi:hypothetical protein
MDAMTILRIDKSLSENPLPRLKQRNDQCVCVRGPQQTRSTENILN